MFLDVLMAVIIVAERFAEFSTTVATSLREVVQFSIGFTVVEGARRRREMPRRVAAIVPIARWNER